MFDLSSISAFRMFHRAVFLSLNVFAIDRLGSTEANRLTLSRLAKRYHGFSNRHLLTLIFDEKQTQIPFDGVKTVLLSNCEQILQDL